VIKEIHEKCAELKSDIEKVFNETQTYIDTLQDTIKEVNENKEREEQKVFNFFEDMLKYIQEKRDEMMEGLNTMYATNAEKLSEKLEHFSLKMEEGEILKSNIIAVAESSSHKLPDVLHGFNQYMRDISDPIKLNLDILCYKFAHEDQHKVFNYLSKFADLKTSTKNVKFGMKSTPMSSLSSSQQQFTPIDFKCLNFGKNILANLNKNNDLTNLRINSNYPELLDASELLENSERLVYNTRYTSDYKKSESAYDIANKYSTIGSSIL
jgi:hypothetical protein